MDQKQSTALIRTMITQMPAKRNRARARRLQQLGISLPHLPVFNEPRNTRIHQHMFGIC